MRTLGWIAIGAVLVGLPAGALVALWLEPERLAGLTDAPVALVEPANATTYDERTGVAVSLAWIAGPTLYAPAWSGLVGQVDIGAGAAVGDGDPIAIIDGVTRLAVRTEVPFHRPLALNSRGPDVVRLHEVLAAMGHLGQIPADPARVNQTSLRAIRALAAEVGVPGTVNAFDPGWFVWLPDEPFDVASVELTAGATAPSTGSPIAAGAPEIGAVGLQRIDGGPFQPEPGVAYVLAVEGLELPLEPETSSLGEAGLAELTGAATPLIDSVGGSVSRAEPLAVWAVPAAAVMAGPQGQVCLWAEAGAGFEPVPVEVVSGRAGVTFIRPPADAARILQNPAEILAEPACPSS